MTRRQWQNERFHRSRSPAGRYLARSRKRMIAGAASAVLAATGLAACGSANAGTGPVTLNYYLYPDTSRATSDGGQQLQQAERRQVHDLLQQLPHAADGQRQQLVRRLAAHDASIDILGLDVTWEAEFAEAGWIQPWTGTNKAQAGDGTLEAR